MARSAKRGAQGSQRQTPSDPLTLFKCLREGGGLLKAACNDELAVPPVDIKVNTRSERFVEAAAAMYKYSCSVVCTPVVMPSSVPYL